MNYNFLILECQVFFMLHFTFLKLFFQSKFFILTIFLTVLQFEYC